ncbi:kinase-like domain-containing protein [Ephemerocybe angulata]|uniref:Kinase-like domain-containing protein n=1 Tax=Ephemerocybe angulata TaxID=980116 RepID=A0A8H6I6G4_9AGAR|nr:kinase-like domain-containing protein [Tulosesus angulatus]
MSTYVDTDTLVSEPETPTSPGAGIADTNDLTDDLVFLEEHAVEHGGYSDIFHGELTLAVDEGEKGKSKQVAIKALRAFSRERLDLERAEKRLNREVYVLKRLRHENIAQFFGISFMHEIRPCIVMRWYSNSTGPRYIEKNPGVDRLALVRDIAAGLSYLHNLQPPIIHGDVKGSNTLVTDDGRAVISDFGLSKAIEEYAGPTGFTTTTVGGSMRWCAPELLFENIPEANPDTAESSLDDSKPVEGALPTLESDIWAFACVAYELFTGNNPYPDDRYDWHVIHAITSRRLPSSKKLSEGRDQWLKASIDLYGVLLGCWSFRPEERPSMREVVDRLLKTSPGKYIEG